MEPIQNHQPVVRRCVLWTSVEFGIHAGIGGQRGAHLFRLIGISDHVQYPLLGQFQGGVIIGLEGVFRIEPGFQNARRAGADFEDGFFLAPGGSSSGWIPMGALPKFMVTLAIRDVLP